MATNAPTDAPAETLAACARLALATPASRAGWRASRGRATRERAEGFVRGAMSGETARGAGGHVDRLLQAARDAGSGRGRGARGAGGRSWDCCQPKSANATEREALDAQRRAERRARTGALDLALRLAEAWLRDVWCMTEARRAWGRQDRRPELERDAAGRAPARLREAVELVQDARRRLALGLARGARPGVAGVPLADAARAPGSSG